MAREEGPASRLPGRAGRIPAVDHDGPSVGSCLWALLHLGHQAQQGPSRFWGLVVRPGGEEDVLHSPALLLVLAEGQGMRTRVRGGGSASLLWGQRKSRARMTPWHGQGPRAGKVSSPFSCSSDSTIPSSEMLAGMPSREGERPKLKSWLWLCLSPAHDFGQSPLTSFSSLRKRTQ